MIRTRREGAVAVVVIDRHERRNSLNEEVCRRMQAAFDELLPELDGEDSVRAVVLTGAGTAFSAGADLSGGVYSAGFTEVHTRLLRTIQDFPAPVVAAVNGAAIGAGVQLALAADVRVADPKAIFGVPVVKVGLALDNWTIHRLANVVGGGHARSVLMLGRQLDAARAAEIGLVNEVGDDRVAMRVAEELAGFAPLTLRHIKTVINDDDAIRAATDEQSELQARAWNSADAAEARAAREERRTPIFRGR